MEREELAAWLRLALTPGLGNTAAQAGCWRPSACRGDVFRQTAAALEQVVTPAQAEALRSRPAQLAGPVRGHPANGWTGTDGRVARRIVTLGDADYPASLLDTDDPPLMLYLMGQADRRHGLPPSPWSAAATPRRKG